MIPRSRVAVVVSSLVFTTGCMTAARVFLDLPEGPSRGERDRAEREALSVEKLDSIIRALQAPPELPPPPIEFIADADSVLAMMPLDRAGSLHWVRAQTEGIIRPRPAGPGVPPDSTQVFPFDVYLGDRGGVRALFPHSVHQTWLSCQSCHPDLYAGDMEEADPDFTHGGESCGRCHNGIAFPIASCERCHESATDLPAGRLSPTFGSPLTLTRAGSQYPENNDRTLHGAPSDLYAPATFSHGAHRIRYQCKACHERPFAMKSGETRLNQDEAHNTLGCGFCHNGVEAFDTGLDDCYRCHVEGGGGSLGGG